MLLHNKKLPAGCHTVNDVSAVVRKHSCIRYLFLQDVSKILNKSQYTRCTRAQVSSPDVAGNKCGSLQLGNQATESFEYSTAGNATIIASDSDLKKKIQKTKTS